MDENDIGKLERGEHRWPAERRREALRAVLEATTDADLGFYIIRGLATGAEPAQATALPEPGTWPYPTISHERQRPRRVNTADVVTLQAMFDALTASDRQFGGGYARRLAGDYLHAVILPCLHATGPEAVLRQLAEVSTQFVLRAAAMDLDAGEALSCRRLLVLASDTADRADDLSIAAWVLARRGEYEIYSDNVAKALAYMAAAVAMAAHASPKAHAFILSKHALALSMTGDAQATFRVLGQARDAAARQDVAEPGWMGVYDLAHIRHDEGRCYANLGIGGKAAQVAQESLRMPDRTRYSRPRAFTLGIQAIGYAQAGEVEQACRIGQELVDIAVDLDSDRVRRRVAEVLRALRGFGQQPEVRDLHLAARPILATPQL